MDMYVRMYDELKKSKEDNQTIGILLCSETDTDMQNILKGNEQLFANRRRIKGWNRKSKSNIWTATTRKKAKWWRIEFIF